jgi:hypothetical protein
VKVLLIYGGGFQREGLLLAVSPERMRVMMPGMTDVLEFRRIDGVWVGESGAAVEIAAAGLLEVPEGTEGLRPSYPFGIWKAGVRS